MAHTSLQVCMDSSDHWFQGAMSEDMSTGMDSSSSPSRGDCMLAVAGGCSARGDGGPSSAPLMERRLRPPHDQNLKCPRCDSTHTKFCYYNNYSLTQPRYFCKTCRRYWTKGGTLRNIPVGGGCRKNNKKSSSKKSSSSGDHHHQGSVSSSMNPTDLHLSSFNQVQFSPHLANLMMSLGGGGGGGGGADFMDCGGSSLIRPIDFLESKYEANIMNGVDQFGVLQGNHNNNNNNNNNNNGNYDVLSTTPTSYMMMGNNDVIHEGNFSSGISFMDQRLLLPYDQGNDHDHDHHHHQNGLTLMDVKPNPRQLISLEWQDQQGCTSDHDHANLKDSSFGPYNVNGASLASWGGIINGFQPSTTN